MILISNLDNIEKYIEIEKNILEFQIQSEHKWKSIILQYMQNFADPSEDISLMSSNNVVSFVEELKSSLTLCSDNITNLENLLAYLADFSTKIHTENLVTELNEFNLKYVDITTNVLDNNLKIQNCLYSISEKSNLMFVNLSNSKNETTVSESTTQEINSNSIQQTVSSTEQFSQAQEIQKNEDVEVFNQNESSQEVKENIMDSSISTNETNVLKEQVQPQEVQHAEQTNPDINNKYPEDTLVISEKSGLVTLPFTMSKVNEVLKKENYSSIDDVIYNKYTIPLSAFKNPSLARFKEGFKLMRHKENSSIIEAVDLGVELMFNYNLHPAIIAACRSLDELDIYLDYLDYGETNKFKCFKILFDLPPAVVKQKNT